MTISPSPGDRPRPPVYYHGGPNRVEPGGMIHQDAMPLSHGRLDHNFFTTDRQVAEDAADCRDGLGHGWIHVIEPTGYFEPDRGEPASWKSVYPLRVVSVEPGRLNGTTPHPPIVGEDSPKVSRRMLVQRGLWYRVHPAECLDLDHGKARSRPVDDPRPGQSGLSAFASPHHLFSYIKEMDWGGRDWLHAYDDGITPRRVVAFHGREIGRGADDEPLIRPEADHSCCGRTVHKQLAWSTFVRNLSGTPRPRAEWSLESAQQSGQQRASGDRAAHRRAAGSRAGQLLILPDLGRSGRTVMLSLPEPPAGRIRLYRFTNPGGNPAGLYSMRPVTALGNEMHYVDVPDEQLLALASSGSPAGHYRHPGTDGVRVNPFRHLGAVVKDYELSDWRTCAAAGFRDPAEEGWRPDPEAGC
jgi:hypothetical protein